MKENNITNNFFFFWGGRGTTLPCFYNYMRRYARHPCEASVGMRDTRGRLQSVCGTPVGGFSRYAGHPWEASVGMRDTRARLQSVCGTPVGGFSRYARHPCEASVGVRDTRGRPQLSGKMANERRIVLLLIFW